MAYTIYEKIEILSWAKDFGTIEAAKKFGIASSTVVRWNRKYKVYETQKMSILPTEKKIEILTFARDNGITNAMHKYDVSLSAMHKWNRTLKIYSNSGRFETQGTKKRYCRETLKLKLEVLLYAKEHGPVAASRKYDIAQSTIAHWNKKYKVYQTRQPRTFSDLQKKEILDWAMTNGFASAAHEFAVTSDQIKQWQYALDIQKQL